MLRTTLLTLLLCLSGCSGGSGGSSGGGGTGELIVEATDAFLPYSDVAAASVAITEVRIHQEAGASQGFLTIYSGPPRWLDLTDLRNGVVAILARADLPPGSYRQLRLVYDQARLELSNGNVYTTDDGSLQITSQGNAGQKVFIEPPVEVVSGLSRTVLLDFDLSKMFKPTPANDPLNATKYKLHPVLRAVNMTTAGEIQGLVTKSDGGLGFLPSPDSTVYLLPPGEQDVLNSITTTGTEVDGSYAFIGVLPGSYDLLADDGVLQGRVDAQAVTKGNVTLVDIVIQ